MNSLAKIIFSLKITFLSEMKACKFFNFFLFFNTISNNDLNNRRSNESNKEKIAVFNKLENEFLKFEPKRKVVLKKTFKEIYENVNYINDNIDKYFGIIFKKNRKKKNPKALKIEDEDLE